MEVCLPSNKGIILCRHSRRKDNETYEKKTMEQKKKASDGRGWIIHYRLYNTYPMAYI